MAGIKTIWEPESLFSYLTVGELRTLLTDLPANLVIYRAEDETPEHPSEVETVFIRGQALIFS